MTHKVLLYYKFVPVADPDMTMRWQHELCNRLNLKGRIIVADHGINGTLGGRVEDLKRYAREMNQTETFKKINYKWTAGTGEDFPRLSVKVRPELVTLAPGEEFDVYNSTKGLSPSAWHKYIEENPDVTILDARNDYESDIGVFDTDGLVAPKIKKFSQIKEELEKLPKDKPVLTYCTGDIRCEYLSAYMKHKGFDEVYHLDGGVVKYGQQFKDEGYWKGKLFTFDDRMNLEFSDQSEDIGACVQCSAKTSNHENCLRAECNSLILLCSDCADRGIFCDDACETLQLQKSE